MMQLPEELLLQILRNLCPSGEMIRCQSPEDVDNLRGLRNISLTSKTLHRIARQVLYHTLNFLRHGSLARRTILRILITQPETADMVARVRLPFVSGQMGVDRGVRFEPPPNDLAQLYTEAVSRLDISSDLQQRLARGLIQGLDDAEFTLLICICRRLRMLEYTTTYDDRRTLLNAVLAGCTATLAPNAPSSSTKPCRYLSKILTKHWTTTECTPVSTLSVMLQLPALQTFEGRMVGTKDDIDLSSIKSEVKKVDLRLSLLGACGMDQLFAACPRLEQFSIQWGFFQKGDTTSARRSNTHVRYDSTAEVLRLRCSLLTSLSMSFQRHRRNEGVKRGALGDLTQLASLKTLSVPLEALFGDGDDGNHDDDSENAGNDGHDRRCVDTDEVTVSERGRDMYLVDTLPRTLEKLSIGSAHSDRQVELHDLQLWRLMNHESFASLNVVHIYRSQPFSHNLGGSSWKASGSATTWQVLERLSSW